MEIDTVLKKILIIHPSTDIKEVEQLLKYVFDIHVGCVVSPFAVRTLEDTGYMFDQITGIISCLHSSGKLHDCVHLKRRSWKNRPSLV